MNTLLIMPHMKAGGLLFSSLMEMCCCFTKSMNS